MSIQLPQAEREIQEAFFDAWDANAGAAIGGATPEVRWEGVAESGPPPMGLPWARVSLLINTGNQVAFGEESGSRRYREIGIITVQIFTPLSAQSDLRDAQALAQVAVDAFRGVETPGGVEFLEVSATRVGADKDGAWFQYNTTAQFNYDSFQ